MDLFLMRKADRLACKDCKVIPRESLITQHRVTLLDIHIKGQHCTRQDPRIPRTRWWNLKGEKLVVFQDRIAIEAPWNLEEGSNTIDRKSVV